MHEFKATINSQYWPGKPTSLNPVPVRYKHVVDRSMIDRIMEFIKISMTNLENLGMKHVVVGLSGGIDSACVLKLCRETLDRDSLVAVIVDLGLDSHKEQTSLSIQIAEEMDVHYELIDASGLLNQYYQMMVKEGPFTTINIITRCIQNAIFQLADSIEAAVACTSDKSEILLGRQMECFYGHFAPIIDLFKTEVMDLSRLIGIPEHIVQREPGCSDAWIDISVLGANYEYVDPILYLLVEKKLGADRIADEFDLDPLWVAKIEERVKFQNFRLITQEFKV